MKTIEDLPRSESVSRLRAEGVIRAATLVTSVAFSEVSFNVAVSHRRFPNGGSWSFFVCSCGRRCRILRLYDGGLACSGCLTARGLRTRVQLIGTEKRAAWHAAKRLARLTSDTPARLHPRPGRMLDRRANLEFALRRSQIVARKHRVYRAKDQGL